VSTIRRVESLPAGPRCHVFDHDGSNHVPFDRATVERLLAGGQFFWLDLAQPDDGDFAILRETFGFHPLAVEDSEHFGQRPKVDDYDDHCFLVAYGATTDDDNLVEVHCFFSTRLLVTVHRDDAPSFAELRRRYEVRETTVTDPVLLLYQILNALTDSFFPLLTDLDERIDQLENETFLQAKEEQLQQIFVLKRELVTMRKAVAPQRDMLQGLAGGSTKVPGMTLEHERYFRDTYDHLIRIGDLIDTYRDLLTSSMDVYLSTVSNRLNVVMKQLAVISTVFLPLTFITGFFGQNFGWMVGHIGGWPAFAVLGLGVELLTVFLLFLLFRRRGWV
jgi:magnesium transporter